MSADDEMIPGPVSSVAGGAVRAACIAAVPNVTVELPYEIAEALLEATVLGDFMELTDSVRKACRKALKRVKS